MRILHISTRLILGGSQENTLLSCTISADRGHEVALAFGPIHGPEGSLLPRLAADTRIERFEVPTLTRSVDPIRDWQCARQLRALIREWKPDVVHTHSSKAGILGRAAGWDEGVPAVVHTIHGLPFHPYQSSLKNWAFVRAERWAAKRCHAIVSVADAMTATARSHGIGRAEQFVTIRSGMEVAAWQNSANDRARTRARFGWDDQTIVLGTVARLDRLKGHDDLIDAFGGLLSRETGGPIAMLWVGDGWWRERLEARLARKNLSHRVTLTGLVDPAEIPALVSAMDLVVHPSYREGLPRAVVQGLLGGKPVIAYDIDGAREVCKHGETGLLVKAGDLTGLQASAAQLIADPALRAAMGSRGRELAQTEFDAQTMVDQLLALYTRILSLGK